MGMYVLREGLGGSVPATEEDMSQQTYTLPDSPKVLAEDGFDLVKSRPANWGAGRAALLGTLED